MNWFQRLTRTGQMEQELDKELRFHFESQVTDKIKAGMTEAQARRATRLEFGGIAQIKEDCRESRGTLWLASIAQDLRFGTRILARSPGFSVTAIVVLALGIGVSTLAFSLYNLLVLQSIPVRDPETLVSIERRSPENIAPNVPYASIAYYRDNAKSLSAVMATMTAPPMVLGHLGNLVAMDTQRVIPSFVSANYFTELGASPLMGRLFEPSSETTPSAPVAILSYRLWQSRFAGDLAIVGKTIYLAGKPVTVAGVTSSAFANLGTENPDLWLPLVQYTYFFEGSKPISDTKFDGNIRMWARLVSGFTRSQSAQELLALTNQLRKMYPTVIWDNERIQVTPGAHFFSLEDGAPILAMVTLLVVLILAIVCANLGGLLMARGAMRHKEIQLRFDLGARRLRVFRQLLTENLLLGLLGASAALPLTCIVLRIALISANAPAWMSPFPDWRVLTFTALMGLLAALFFGMLPTLQLVRRNRQRNIWNQLVVCAQVGASCVLLILAGLLVRATLHTLYTDPGFGYEQVLAINPGLHDHGYTHAAAKSYLEELQIRLRAMPGVTSVSLARNPPLITGEVMINGMTVNGHRILMYPNWVGPDFFQTMSIPLLRGRFMQPGETHAVILSESLARKVWSTEDPIGKRWRDTSNIVIGVVGNTRAMELNNSDATEIYYPPTAENLPDMSVLVKAPATNSIQTIAASIDTKLFPTITPLKAGFRKNVAQLEQIATIISLLGSIAIFLAVVGLLGLVTYAVTQRTKELAIRLALGASRAEIIAAVLRRFARPVILGLIVGVGITAALSQVIRRGLYGISGLDPISYVSAIGLLIAILALAAFLPIRRALRLDVARILHQD